MRGSLKSAGIFRLALPWFLPGILLLTWICISMTDLVPGYLLPHTGDVFRTGMTYVTGNQGDGPYAGRFLRDAASSLERVSFGFGLAVVTGLPLGILSGRSTVMDRALNALVNGMRAVPGIAWLPLAIVWFGIGIKTTVFLVALAAFFPVYLNAAQGARQVDPLLLRAGAMLGVEKLRSILLIVLPGAMPHIVTGLRLGLGISWAYLVLGELTGVPDGLGAVIMDARMIGRVDMILVGMVLIACIGKLSDLLLVGMLRMCLKSAGRMA